MVELARVMVARDGHLPTASKMREAEYASMVQYLYQLGKTWGDLREAADSLSNRHFRSTIQETSCGTLISAAVPPAQTASW